MEVSRHRRTPAWTLAPPWTVDDANIGEDKVPGTQDGAQQPGERVYKGSFHLGSTGGGRARSSTSMRVQSMPGGQSVPTRRAPGNFDWSAGSSKSAGGEVTEVQMCGGWAAGTVLHTRRPSSQRHIPLLDRWVTHAPWNSSDGRTSS